MRTLLFAAAIVLVIILGVIVFVMVPHLVARNDLHLSLVLAGTIAAVAAVILGLVSLAMSIKQARIRICLGDKSITSSGTLLEVRVGNRGNAMGNMASAFVQIEVAPSDPISFDGAPGLSFSQSANPQRKQYRFDNLINPMPLYPAQYIWSLLGFLSAPLGPQRQVKFSVQVVGTQGRTRKEFETTI